HRRQDHPPERELHRSGGPDLRADRPPALTHRVAPSPASAGGSILLARHAVQGARPTGALRRAGRAGAGPAAASLPGTPAARAPPSRPSPARGGRGQLPSFESPAMNSLHRKPLPGTQLDWYDAREAVEALQPG